MLCRNKYIHAVSDAYSQRQNLSRDQEIFEDE